MSARPMEETKTVSKWLFQWKRECVHLAWTRRRLAALGTWPGWHVVHAGQWRSCCWCEMIYWGWNTPDQVSHFSPVSITRIPFPVSCILRGLAYSTKYWVVSFHSGVQCNLPALMWHLINFSGMMGIGGLNSITHWSMIRVRAEAVFCAYVHDFYTFVALDILVWVSSLVCGATSPTGWPFKGVKAWSSTLVHPAKVVLLVSNLIYCFNILPCYPLTLLLANYRGNGTFTFYSSAQFCILWPWNSDPRLLSIW